MTDNEIIKALECCAGDDGCDVCPMYKPSSECITELQGKALDLINRQKAENERLNKEVNKQQLRRQIRRQMYRSTVEEIKSEAIKEFAERLKKKYKHNKTSITSLVTLFDNINNLVNEMCGE